MAVCAFSAVAADESPSLSDASAVGFEDGELAFIRGLDQIERVRVMARTMALRIVCYQDKDPYVDTLQESQHADAIKLMSKPHLDKYTAVSASHGEAYLSSYYAAFNKISFGYALGYAESYQGRIDTETNPQRKATLKRAACDLSAKMAKDIFFEMNRKPAPTPSK